MATVTVNVNANTSDATQDINKLDSALNSTEQSADDLNNSLEKQEARIKTLGGAINIVGGSVEVLAGSLALSGALSEEQAESFQTAAIGALAFADGTKRVFEGAKELKEGLTAASSATKGITIVQRIYNAVLNANPIFLLATVLATVTIGIIALTRALSRQADEQERLNGLTEKQQVLLGLYDRALALAQIRKEDEVTILNLTRKRIDAEIKGNKDIIAELESRRSLNEEEQQLLDDSIARNKELAEEVILNSARVKQALKEQREEDRLEREQELQAELDRYAKVLEDNADKLAEATGAIVESILDEILGKTKDKILELPDLIISEIELEEVEDAGEVVGEKFVTGFDLSFREGMKEVNVKLQKFFASETATAIGSNLQAASDLTSALVEVVDDGSEEAFENAKKYKIAEVITSSTQAAFQAFAAAQQFGPILGPILGTAQVAAITAAASRAIGDIRSSTFDGGGGPSGVAAGSVSVPAIGFGSTDFGGGATATSTPQGVGRSSTPLRAYVIAGDVSNGLEAETLLQARRQFP